MKRLLLRAALLPLIALFFSLSARAQTNNWAVGFRIGEPAGLNVRKYFGENQAFDVNIGTYGGVYGTRRDYRRGRYRNVGLSIQGHYLWHGGIGKSQTLHYYYGFGGQINRRAYFPDRNINESVPETSLGGSGVAGLEYFMPNKPFSIFLETGLYVEVLPSPFFFGLQSGLGVRLNL
ncbi:hypothetical protein [Larkinella soli]|uniref:hypothetical protein n=1 Tax=Larkinella soli TaxID=1770527 RepID=UPI000FFC55A4|nr:hypothetical protein [Larkinella soli]